MLFSSSKHILEEDNMSFFTLKLVALLSMLFDHVTSVWPVSWFVWDLFFPHATETPHIALAIQSLTDYIGRIAAPVFLFFIANGYRYTHSVKQYALRLLVFACLSEWPYYLLFGMHGNIIFTLFWGLITLWLFEHGNRLHPWLGWTLAAAVILVAEVLALAEGTGRYLILILAFYLTDHWSVSRKFLLFLFLLPVTRYALTWDLLSQAAAGTLTWRWIHLWAVNTIGPLLGVALTFRYNGKKGLTFPVGKYLWYFFYPAHLLILALMAG